MKSLDPQDQDMKFLDEYLKFEEPKCLNLIAIKAIRVSVYRLLNKDQKFFMSILKNGLAETFIKRMKLITRVLLMKMKLPSFYMGHVILHDALLIWLRPVDNHQYFSVQLAFGNQPNIIHLRVFGCVIYVPIALSQHTEMKRHCGLGIDVEHHLSFNI